MVTAKRILLLDGFKEAQLELDLAAFEKYPELSETEIRSLVVEDKWHATLQRSISTGIERVKQQLSH